MDVGSGFESGVEGMVLYVSKWGGGRHVRDAPGIASGKWIPLKDGRTVGKRAEGQGAGMNKGAAIPVIAKRKSRGNANKDNNVNSRKCSDCQCGVNTQRSR